MKFKSWIETLHCLQHGIPIRVVRFRFDEGDVAVFRAMQSGAAEICGHLKGAVFPRWGDQPGGFASHEVGTVRMGRDPKTSALDGYCQSHDVKNLFVTDGSCFTTSSEKNPTLTIMALSMRAAQRIADLRKRRELPNPER